jgi:hypothetical protein
MSILSRKPTALEDLRAAQANLETVKIQAPKALQQAVLNCGRSNSDWHPSFDHANQLIAEAELRLAEKAGAYAAAEPEAVQLCSAIDAALAATRDALAPIKDDAEPTLASTAEAKAEYQGNLAKHADALKANKSSRLSILVAAAARIAKAAVPGSEGALLDQVSAAVDDAKSKLAAVVDPEAPELGAVSPVTVSALSRALATHRAHLEANAKKREGICQDLLPVLRAISTAHQSLAKKRHEQNLPGPGSLFSGTIAGERLSLGRLTSLAEGAALTPELCDQLRGAIGCQPANAAGPEAMLQEIADRRKDWERKQAANAAASTRDERGATRSPWTA